MHEFEQLYDAIHLEKAHASITKKHLLPRIYSYGKEDASELLHLISGGTLTISLLLSLRIEPIPCFLLIFSAEGSLRITQGKETCTLNAGETAALDLSRPSEFFTTSLPCVFRTYFVSGTLCPSLKNALHAPEAICPAGNLPSALSLEALQDFPEQCGDSALFQMHAALTTIFCSYAIARLGTGQPSGFGEVLPQKTVAGYLAIMEELIHQHSEEPYTLEDFEDRLGISKFRLCREYERAYGISPMKDLNRARIERAKNLLLTTSMQIQEISLDVGFDNVSHFIRLFKKETGMTPKQFRQSSIL